MEIAVTQQEKNFILLALEISKIFDNSIVNSADNLINKVNGYPTMDKDQEIDVVICTLVDEDSVLKYSVKTGVDKIPELQPLKDYLWMSTLVSSYDANYLTEYLQEILLPSNIVTTEEFPYAEFKEAKNPKVLTVYY